VSSAATATDVSLLALRAGLGTVFVAHGYNHIFGGGKIAGTGRWFESMGMRPGILHAWVASLTELGSGVLLLLGLATPLACAGVVGTMLVAGITNHLRNGFFIFRPGEGYEYVLFLALAGLALGALGAGGWSIDRLIVGDDIGLHADGWKTWFFGGHGLLITALGGGGGAALLLATCWRPNR
jgi:putative oxidoreductase